MREITDPAGKRLVILGAGGASRAIAVETALAGAARITIVNRHAERGRQLVALLQSKTRVEAEFVPWEGEYEVAEGTEVLINATPIGMYPDVAARVPLRIDSLTRGTVVADVIATPPQTRLLTEAADRGCTVLDGLGMLVNQGVISFRLWTGQDPDPSVMRAALQEVFAS